MTNRFDGAGRDSAKRCAVCGGRFGLIRHHSWRTSVCSKRCIVLLRHAGRMSAMGDVVSQVPSTN